MHEGTALQLVRFRRQSRNAQARVSFMTNVEAYQKSGDLLDNTGIFQLPTVQCAHAGNLAGQSTHFFGGVFIVAADNDVAIHRTVGVQDFG